MFIVEMILGAGILYYATRNIVDVKVRPFRIVENIYSTQKTASSIIQEIRMLLMSKTAREEAKAQQKAQELYDRTVGGIFQNATDEEKNTLLALFRKYMAAD